MTKLRKVRDIDSGISYFFNIETGERISDNRIGLGLINTLVSPLASNKTKDSSSDVIKQNKAIKQKKTTKHITNIENKGKMIVELLKTHPDNMKFKSKTQTKKTKDQLNNDILRIDFDNIIEM